MDAYAALERQARKKRDAAISRARVEYRDTLQRIHNLRDALGESVEPDKRAKPKAIIELIQDLMPRDRAFMFADVLRILRDAEPNREFNDPSIRTMLAQLDKRGIVRRVGTNQRGRVLWVAGDSKIEAEPYGQASLVDMAETILQKYGPMRPAELVVAIRETGYRADADPHATMAVVRQLLRRYTKRFNRGGDGRWGVACP
jgi:hypothetical protein